MISEVYYYQYNKYTYLLQKNPTQLVTEGVVVGQDSLHRRSHLQISELHKFTGDLRRNAATRGGQRESTVFLSEFSIFRGANPTQPVILSLRITIRIIVAINYSVLVYPYQYTVLGFLLAFMSNRNIE